MVDFREKADDPNVNIGARSVGNWLPNQNQIRDQVEPKLTGGDLPSD